MPRATRIGRPIRITARMPATTMYSSQVRLKFSASTAWRRTNGDLSPATSSTTRGPRKPSATYAAAKLDRWAAIPQLRSAAGVSGAAGWTAMVGWDISNSPVPVGERVCSMPRTLGAPAPPAYRAHPPLLGGATPRLSGGDEVDQLLDAARQGRLQVGVSADAGQDALPAAGDVRLARVRPAERLQGTDLPRRASGDVGPRGQAEPLRAHGLPDVDVGVTDDEHVRREGAVGHRRLGDPRLLAPRHQVVDEHAQAPRRPRREGAHLRGQVVDAVQGLDDDTLDAQVVAPHLLDELGVVAALHPDPRATRDARPLVLHGARAARRPVRRRRPRRSSSSTTCRPPLFSTPTTAPHQPVSTSSTTRPGSAATSGTVGGACGAARTSRP